MRKIAVAFLAAALAAGGCGDLSLRKNYISKTFFNRTITYTVAPGAKEYMSRLENLLSQARQIEIPLPDNVLLPLYRDADVDRDHRITATEAKAFYHEYVLKFEDSLGRVDFK